MLTFSNCPVGVASLSPISEISSSSELFDDVVEEDFEDDFVEYDSAGGELGALSTVLGLVVVVVVPFVTFSPVVAVLPAFPSSSSTLSSPTFPIPIIVFTTGILILLTPLLGGKAILFGKLNSATSPAVQCLVVVVLICACA